MTSTPDRLRQPRTEAGRPDRLTQAVARALFAARAAGFENETEGELYRMAGNFREAYAVTPTFIEALGEYGYRILAIEDEAASPVPALTLDAAWAEAEAAAQWLGPNWHVAVVNRDVKGDEYHGWRASANDGKYLEQVRHADTPAAALHALAVALATPDTETP